VRSAFRSALARWAEAARAIGFFLLLVAGSAAIGLAIAWPLWLFATSQKRLFSLCILFLLAAGLLFLAARAIARRKRATRDPGRPLSSLLSVLLTALLVVIVPAGAYLAAVLFLRGLWVLAVPALLLWIGLLWLLGYLRGLAKGRKARVIPAENKGE
jgi:hypothetical protein